MQTFKLLLIDASGSKVISEAERRLLAKGQWQLRVAAYTGSLPLNYPDASFNAVIWRLQKQDPLELVVQEAYRLVAATGIVLLTGTLNEQAQATVFDAAKMLNRGCEMTAFVDERQLLRLQKLTVPITQLDHDSAIIKPRQKSVDQITINQAQTIEGYFDRCVTSGLSGWIWNSETPECRLEAEIICDGQLVGRLLADKFRSDLLAAKIGDGKYMFEGSIPEALFDGKQHSIEVREKLTGLILTGSPKLFQASLAKHNDTIRLDGGALVGWAKLPDGVDISCFGLEAVESSHVIAVGQGTPDSAAPNIIRFHLPLPAVAFDGRPHHFSVRGNNPSLLIGDLVVITPYMLTPEIALRQYAREGLKPALATMAGFRYQSVLESIKQLIQCNVLENWHLALTQIIGTHRQLVRGFNEDDKSFAPLVFPVIENPHVSIVIPMHNKFPVTYQCLASLLLAANHTCFELILVDDGSEDETTRIPELIKGVQYLRNNEMQGFVGACNAGAELARGEYIVMLNNDTEVTAHWLDELLWPFEHFDQVGLTGAKLLYPDGSLQEAGGVVWNTGDPCNYGRQANPHEPRYNYTRQVDYISGACIMLPLCLWNELGGFDKTFAPAYFEDADLAFRVRNKGYKTVYAPFSQVIHFEGVSSGISTASGMKRFQEINRPKFKQRWTPACRHHGKVGIDLDLNKDRNIEFRALVLDAETPMPDQNAGSHAAIQEMRMLQALGFKCTFVPQNMAWMGHYTEALQRMGIECLYAPFVFSFNEVIEKRGSEFDLIYITRYYVAQHYVDFIRQYAPQAKIVMMNADLHFLRELRAAVQNKSAEVLARSIKTRDAELATMRKVDLVLAYTDVEKAVILSHNLDSTCVAKCPWVTDVLNDVPGFEERSDIAFLGGFNHVPNVEAVEWFAEKVMPLLYASLPALKFCVYGSNVPKTLLALAEKNDRIVVKGWVPNVDAVYNTCRIFIAPLQSGAGIKGKVIDALAHGVPCILSPIAAEGIAVGDGIHACIAEKPEEWIKVIAGLYHDACAWSDMSRQALVFARNQYGLAKGIRQMRDALQQAEIFTTIENNTLALR